MELLTPDIGLFFWNALAFIIVLILLRAFAWKPILKALHDREYKIEQAIQSSMQLEDEVIAMKVKNEEQLKIVAEERQQILLEAKNIANNMIQEAKLQAKKEAEQIIVDAQSMIESQKNKMLNEAKTEITSLVITISEKVLEKALEKKKDQEKLILSLSKEIEIN
ncbi:MAG: F0F1 ATP synthase subunit B [Chitinophagaceae bacterium]